LTAALALDHLVVAARTLDEGVAWCEATLGITPGPGGRHALMGTHNRLFSIASARFPRAYFEIIAIDPDAPPPPRARWFDLDAPALRHALAGAPQLIHWVARSDDTGAQCERWRRVGIERGELLAAQRETALGVLRWRISVRSDGARLFDGALPTLIEWGGVHPTGAMAPSGVLLERLAVAGLPAVAWPPGIAAGVETADAAAPLVATLATPRGRVILQAAVLGERDVQP
jgi:hypothetical protein